MVLSNWRWCSKWLLPLNLTPIGWDFITCEHRHRVRRLLLTTCDRKNRSSFGQAIDSNLVQAACWEPECKPSTWHLPSRAWVQSSRELGYTPVQEVQALEDYISHLKIHCNSWHSGISQALIERERNARNAWNAVISTRKFGKFRANLRFVKKLTGSWGWYHDVPSRKPEEPLLQCLVKKGQEWLVVAIYIEQPHLSFAIRHQHHQISTVECNLIFAYLSSCK